MASVQRIPAAARLAVFAGFALLLMVTAGRLDWVEGWCWLGLLVGGSLVTRPYVLRRNPDISERRRRIGAGTPRWDIGFVRLIQASFLGLVVIAALDSGRYGWSHLSGWWSGLGGLAIVAGLAGVAWAMGENPHFEATVRIQEEHAHRVIDSGPYRRVRHPGYTSFILALFGSALMLRSAWALLPAAMATLVLVVRTALEDRFLRARLGGYREYAMRVRHRLVPHVW